MAGLDMNLEFVRRIEFNDVESTVLYLGYDLPINITKWESERPRGDKYMITIYFGGNGGSSVHLSYTDEQKRDNDHIMLLEQIDILFGLDQEEDSFGTHLLKEGKVK